MLHLLHMIGMGVAGLQTGLQTSKAHPLRANDKCKGLLVCTQKMWRQNRNVRLAFCYRIRYASGLCMYCMYHHCKSAWMPLWQWFAVTL